MSEILRNGENNQENNGFDSLSELKDAFDPAKAMTAQKSETGLTEQEKIKDLKDFYDVIENPIDNDETLSTIIDVYSGSDQALIYKDLQKIGIEQKTSSYIDVEAKERLNEKMYGRWRRAVVGVTDGQFEKTDGLRDGFLAFRDFVNKHPECQSESDLRAVIKQLPNEKKSRWMSTALDLFNWYHEKDTWTHVKSEYINARQEDKIEEEHRFYLNTDSTDTHATADALADLYEKNQVPYYFKFSEVGRRADTIVIYTSTKGLVDNLNVLRQLKKEHPELALHKTPILTGTIDGDIGYGAQPEKGSYSEVRSELIQIALKGATADWLAMHQNDKILYHGERISVTDYVIKKQMKGLRKRLSDSFMFRLDSWKKGQQTAIGKVDENEAAEMATRECGYSQRDLQDDSRMLRFIKDEIAEKFPETVESIRSTGSCDKLTINGRGDKSITILDESFLMIIRGITSKIAKHDKSYLDLARKRIREECAKRDIGPEKFVFDNPTVAKMQEQYRADMAQE